MFSYLSPEERVPEKHPLRPIRLMVDVALKALSPTFGQLYSTFGRPSIPPEKLLRALLLQVLYTVRSERMLMEQLEYNLLFRWFVGLNMDEAVCGCRRCSPRIGTGFGRGTSPISSFKRY
jgi:transposase